MGGEKVTSKFNQVSDGIFGFLLIILMIGSIVAFFVFIFSTDREVSSLVSASGTTGSAILYMKWNVVRRTDVKPAGIEEVGNFLKPIKSPKDDE